MTWEISWLIHVIQLIGVTAFLSGLILTAMSVTVVLLDATAKPYKCKALAWIGVAIMVFAMFIPNEDTLKLMLGVL